ncbi:MAG TPA: HAMP domain-containing sensor histidine kinase, partial [Anaerovoracaceae bacterium]|nr:HAMP domain-containing sensor histidine kinase [Anaerovoracaceae bacterium]
AFTELTGYSKSDFCQKRISEVLQKLFGFDLDIDELEKSAISEIFLFKKSCEVIEVSIKVCQSEGENHKFYFVKQKPDFILNFELSFIDKLMKDNTENMLKRKYLEEKNEELRKTIEMKDEMLLLISHELKTPLSIITSSIQTLEIVCKNELSEKVRKYLNKIKQNTYRQLKLVNNILDNTRVNAGLFRMNQASVDIVLLTKTIIESITVFAERKGINISFSSTITQSVIHTDVDIYERILLNLLSNAVKFTPEGRSIEVNIFQMLTKENHKVCIEVKDNGIGIPSDQKDLIFERFKRVDRVVVRHSEGTGIGLYLVKMLVSLLEGEIKVESKEGVGSTFSLIFPLVKINKASMEPAIIETSNEKLITATAIEFSDIYYGT